MTYERNEASMPTPPKPTGAQKPKLHLDLTNGRFITNEAITHLECLLGEHNEALGDARRHLADRIWLWRMHVDELRAYHGLEDGEL